LKSCGDCAFQNCPSLTALDFRPCPNLAEIGEKPFDGCSGLGKIQFGSAVAVMASTFANCPALEIVTVPFFAPVPTGLPTNVRTEVGDALTSAEVPRRMVDGQLESGGTIGEIEALRRRLQLAERELAVERQRKETFRDRLRLAIHGLHCAREELAILRARPPVPPTRSRPRRATNGPRVRLVRGESWEFSSTEAM
jgi:hypothetical protein